MAQLLVKSEQVEHMKLITLTEQHATIEEPEDEWGRGGGMGSQPMETKNSELGKMTTTQEATNQIATPTQPSQPVLDFCPSPNKHFFCGMARKLGCQFCAPK